MRQETINIYTFEELSEKAQAYAWLHGPDFSCDWDTDYNATLTAFEKLFDVQVSGNTDRIYSMAGKAANAPEGDALRLTRYLWNNYADQITKGKYYCTPRERINGKFNYKHRYSNIFQQMDNCPLTGFCADCDILQPFIDTLHYKRFFDNIEDLLNACLENFFQSVGSRQRTYKQF